MPLIIPGTTSPKSEGKKPLSLPEVTSFLEVTSESHQRGAILKVINGLSLLSFQVCKLLPHWLVTSIRLGQYRGEKETVAVRYRDTKRMKVIFSFDSQR